MVELALIIFIYIWIYIFMDYILLANMCYFLFCVKLPFWTLQLAFKTFVWFNR